VKFGINLRAARLKAGLTQAALSTRSGVDPASVSRFENGKGLLTRDVARQLAEALSTDLEDLLGARERPTERPAQREIGEGEPQECEGVAPRMLPTFSKRDRKIAETVEALQTTDEPTQPPGALGRRDGGRRCTFRQLPAVLGEGIRDRQYFSLWERLPSMSSVVRNHTDRPPPSSVNCLNGETPPVMGQVSTAPLKLRRSQKRKGSEGRNPAITFSGAAGTCGKLRATAPGGQQG
jgi:transcriptional regulator with XRE-family HTH domain